MMSLCNYSIVCLIADSFESHMVIDDMHYIVADIIHENDVENVFKKAEELKPAYTKVIIVNNHVVALEAVRIQKESLLKEIKEMEQSHGI